MRNTLVIISKKLAVLSFLGMFVYIIFAKIFNLNPVFAIFFFIGSFFFFGLMTLPTKSSVKFFSAWILPAGMMFAVVGLTLVFVPLIFGSTLESNTVIVGGIFFMLSISTLLSTAFVGNKDYRSVREIGEVEFAFNEASKMLGLSISKSQTKRYVDYCADGIIPEGNLRLKVGTRKGVFSVRVADYSTLALSNVKNKIKPGIKIESMNDTLEVENLPDEIAYSVTSFIKEKQLDYFNFRLNALSDGIQINIDVTLEEKEAWIDYLELMKRIVI